MVFRPLIRTFALNYRCFTKFWGYTWYMQSVLNRLYEQNKQVADEGQLKEALHTIMADKANQYEMLLSFLSDNQRRLLLAIAAEWVVAQPNANSFLQNTICQVPAASTRRWEHYWRKIWFTILQKDISSMTVS